MKKNIHNESTSGHNRLGRYLEKTMWWDGSRFVRKRFEVSLKTDREWFEIGSGFSGSRLVRSHT